MSSFDPQQLADLLITHALFVLQLVQDENSFFLISADSVMSVGADSCSICFYNELLSFRINKAL